MLGLTLPKLLQAQQTTPQRRKAAKSVIFLFQWGGPSHVDTFDMKLSAPSEYRSKYKPISSSVPGLNVCEHLPETAKVLHHFAQIRTVHHTMNNHNSAGYTALTGVEPPIDDQRLRESLDLFPSFGSVVDKVAPNTNNLPTYVSYPWTIADGSVTPGQGASFLGKLHDPLFIPNDPNGQNFELSQLSLPANVTTGRLDERRELQKLIKRFGQPRVVITDKLRSYVKPVRDQMPDADHRPHKGLNNRIEGAHRPTRKREKLLGRFKSPHQAQRFLAAHDQGIAADCRRVRGKEHESPGYRVVGREELLPYNRACCGIYGVQIARPIGKVERSVHYCRGYGDVTHLKRKQRVGGDVGRGLIDPSDL